VTVSDAVATALFGAGTGAALGAGAYALACKVRHRRSASVQHMRALGDRG
jgi:hypothetical protein